LRIQGVKLVEVGTGPDEVGVIELSCAYAEAARRTARVIFLENILFVRPGYR